MKTILIPTDFSPVSDKALHYGLGLVRREKEGGKVLLLNTFLVPSSNPNQLVTLHDDLKRKSLDRLEETLLRLRGEEPEISFEPLSFMGSLDNVIAYLARERQVDCIVMGINGSLRREEVVKLLGKIECPILLVPFQGK